MNFFQQELQKIVGNSEILKGQQYAGRSCYGVLDGDIRARVEFVTMGVCGRYEGIKTTLFNRKEGPIDSMVVRFADLFGKKKVENPNFKEGLIPHVWENRNSYEWYVYQLSAQDYKALSQQIEGYLSVFQEQTIEQTAGMQQMS